MEDTNLFNEDITELSMKIVENSIESVSQQINDLSIKVNKNKYQDQCEDVKDKLTELNNFLNTIKIDFEHKKNELNISNSKWKLVSGCIPCSFLCDKCDKIYYRCSSGAKMYKKNNPKNILCGQCYLDK